LTSLTTDFHAHCFRPDLIPRELHEIRAETILARRRRPGQAPSPDDAVASERMVDRMIGNMEDRDGRLLREDLESAGVERAVVVGLDWGTLRPPNRPETAPGAWLEWAEELIGLHDGYFSYVAGIDPRRPDARELARTALAKPWVVGLKIYPPVGFSPTDPACDALYQEVIEAGAFMMTHTGRQTYPFDIEKGRLEPYALVQSRFPDMRLVLAHAGWPLWGDHAIEVAAGHPDSYVELSGWHHAVGQDEDKLRRFLRSAWAKVGPQRVIWATDHMSGPRFVEQRPEIARWKAFVEETAVDAGVDLSLSEQGALDLLERR
jgi:predicted TIM-barrel fold metal-dependent hydrolase